jgi:hypothetical protein
MNEMSLHTKDKVFTQISFSSFMKGTRVILNKGLYSLACQSPFQELASNATRETFKQALIFLLKELIAVAYEPLLLY